jgi:FkbM family methyltransferase
LIRRARRAGLFVGRYPPDALVSGHLHRVIGARRIGVVVDVGAHEGGYGTMLRSESAFAGRIVSFEPAPESFARLAERSAGDAKWEPHQLALGDVDGRQTLHLYPASQVNSFLPMRDGSWAADAFGAPTATDVEVRRLDAVFDELVSPASSPVLLKIDAQGTDLAVLAGAAGCLASVAAIQIEAAVEPIYAGAPALAETIERLGDLGIALSGIFAVEREPPEWIRLVDVDCVFVRR